MSSPDAFFRKLLWQQGDDNMKEYLSHRDKYHLQILYIQIDRDQQNQPHFRELQYHVSSDDYFYPASLVKMPIALAALERLNQLLAPDIAVSVKADVKKCFIVSDNEAANRLYDFVGHEQLNKMLGKKEFENIQIRHLLGINIPLEEGAFSNKNRASLADLCHILQVIFFPENVSPHQKFLIKEEDYDLLYQYMSEYPHESVIPQWDGQQFGPNYCKFLLAGGWSSNELLPECIRIFNKSGWAYGFLSDVAYIADFKNKIEFIAGATMFVNENNTFDNGREYETIGQPFMKNLGKMLYDYEIRRSRKYLPDLSRFRVQSYN